MPDSLSDIELYFSPKKLNGNEVIIEGEEFKHAAKVMRHFVGDILFITDGQGNIYKSEITDLYERNLTANVVEIYSFENKMRDVYFCIPKLKSQERFEFALEKCVELGITNFIVFEPSRCIAKGEKTERWEKILIAAMKQSLRSYLPTLKIMRSLKEIISLEGKKILFEQHSAKSFLNFNLYQEPKQFFLFGPEGGFTDEEICLVEEGDRYSLGNNRLRSETAITAVAAILTTKE